MRILKAEAKDGAELVNLINSAYRGETSKIGWTTEAHLLEGNRIDDEKMQGYLADNKVTILKYVDDAGAIKGCVYLEVKEDRVYLGMLTVSPWEQATGIGRKLLTAAESFCSEQKCIGIQITVINTRHELIDWYKRCGFYETGEILPFKVPKKFGKAIKPIHLTVMNKDLDTLQQ